MNLIFELLLKYVKEIFKVWNSNDMRVYRHEIVAVVLKAVGWKEKFEAAVKLTFNKIASLIVQYKVTRFV